MSTRRVGVINADGVYINTILVEDYVLVDPDYWPGYGLKLIDLGEETVAPPVFKASGKPKDFGVLNVTPSEAMQPGDTIDFTTGKVTKAVPVITVDPAIDPVTDVGPVVIANP